MQHVWLSRQPQKDKMLRVWDTVQKNWQWLSDWQALKAHNSDKNLCLYVPTQAVLSITSDLTTAQLKQLGAAGQQYLFEDASLTPVEQLQVKSMSLADQHYMYALAGAQIDQWQQGAGLVDFVVQVILPDFLLLPTPEARLGSQVALYYDEDTTLLRSSEAYGMGVSYLPSLSAHLNAVAALDEIHLFTTTQHLAQLQSLIDANYTPLAQDISPSSGTASDVDINVVGDDGAKSLLAQRLAASPAEPPKDQPVPQSLNSQTSTAVTEAQELVSMLQATGVLVNVSTEPLSPVTNPERHPLNMVKINRQSKLSPYLKTALTVALFALVLQISADALQWYQYEQAKVATKQATAEQYAYWFDGETLNTRTTLMAQVTPKLLPAQSADTSQLSVLSRVAPLLQQSDMMAQSLAWDEAAIHMTVFSERREGLDKLVNTLSQQGIKATLGSVAPQADGGLVGELTLPLASSSTAEPSNVS